MNHSHWSKDIDIEHFLDLADIGVYARHCVTWREIQLGNLGRNRGRTEWQQTNPTTKKQIISLKTCLQFEYSKNYLSLCLRVIHEDMKTTFGELFHLHRERLHGLVIGDI